MQGYSDHEESGKYVSAKSSVSGPKEMETQELPNK